MPAIIRALYVCPSIRAGLWGEMGLGRMGGLILCEHVPLPRSRDDVRPLGLERRVARAE